MWSVVNKKNSNKFKRDSSESSKGLLILTEDENLVVSAYNKQIKSKVPNFFFIFSPMSKWCELPTEILLQVLKEIEKEAEDTLIYLQCLLVCSNWNRITCIHLYKTIYVDSHVTQRKLIRCLNESRLGQIVECMDFSASLYLIEGVIQQFAELCPNVKRIEYFRDPKRDLYDQLAQHFKNLEQIPSPSMYEESEYIHCALRYQHSLKVLYIPRKDHPMSEKGKWLTHQIQQFPKLHSLIAHDTTAGLRDFEEMMDICQVKEFRMYTNEAIDIAQECNHSFIKPCCNIQSLNAAIDFDDGLFPYIMQRFPNLKYLEINIYFPRTTSTKMKQVRYFANHLQTFLNYLQSIPKYNIKFHSSIELLSNIMEYTNNGDLSVSVYSDPSLYQAEDLVPEISIEKHKASLSYSRYCQRSHLFDIWTRCSKHIIHLDLCMTVINKEDKIYQSILDVFATCKRIKSVEYTIECDMILPIELAKTPLHNHSLRELFLKANYIYPEVYTIYSHWLPGLKRLSIEIPYKSGSQHKIPMPQTHLNSLKLVFRDPVYLQHGLLLQASACVVLKIRTNAERKVYTISQQDGLVAIEETNVPVRSIILTIDISCRSIGHLDLMLLDTHLLKHSFCLK